MNIYDVQATGPYPVRYRGLLGNNADQAIDKAKERHHIAGYLVKHNYVVTSCRLVVCNTVVENEPETPHTLSLDDQLLAEVEMALLERATLLGGQVDRAKKNGLVNARALQQRLQRTMEALTRVMAL